MKHKIQSLLQKLDQGLVEREQVLKLALLCTLAGENIVLVGPPGTGKSLVARRIAQSMTSDPLDGDGGYFEYLLTKFSTPEELFGPLSISALKADRFHRNTEGYLPTVRMAFLDEIFKASSSILNALLTILNERVYHNGTQVQQVPLQALIAASNELPTDQEELGALYDRFLVRAFVDYVQTQNLPRLFAPTVEPTLDPPELLGSAELRQIRQLSDQVVFPPELIQAVQDIWAAHKESFKEDRRESLSDRRLKKVIHLLRVSAATNGRTAVDLSDALLLKDCLWNHPDNAAKVQELVKKTLQRHSRLVPKVSTETQIEPAAAETYLLAPDGKTLVSTRSFDTRPNTPASGAHTPGKTGAVIKGFAGSGTEEDPLLIQSVDDLMDLARPEVGQKGYHFRQTADLDISGINTWSEIDFQGSYDGNGFTIKDKPQICVDSNFNPAKSANSHRWIFKELQASQVTRLTMKYCGLTIRTQTRCILLNCKTSVSLVFMATETELRHCEADTNIIASAASNCIISNCMARCSIADATSDCQISSCQSGFPLIFKDAEKTTIHDCISTLNFTSFSGISLSIGLTFGEVKEHSEHGGIVARLRNSSINRCHVSGKWDSLLRLSGIVQSAESGSAITNCAVAQIVLPRDRKLHARISGESGTGSTLKNNVAIDSLIAERVNDGESIAAARFNRRYFELTLGWDFEKVWAWDSLNNHPVLRHVGVTTQALQETPAAGIQKSGNTPQVAQVDLLTQQVKSNIWL